MMTTKNFVNGRYTGNLDLENYHYPGSLDLENYHYPLPATLTSLGGYLYLLGYDRPLPEALTSVSGSIDLEGYGHPLPEASLPRGLRLPAAQGANLGGGQPLLPQWLQSPAASGPALFRSTTRVRTSPARGRLHRGIPRASRPDNVGRREPLPDLRHTLLHRWMGLSPRWRRLRSRRHEGRGATAFPPGEAYAAI